MADRLTSIRKQIAALEKKADELRKSENSKVIARIKALIDKHELTAADLGFEQSASTGTGKTAKRGARATGAKRQAAAGVGVPKYRDPKSGKTWTGRGKPPAWIASARDRSRYLIDDEASSDVASARPAKASKSPKARNVKKVAKAAPKRASRATKPLASPPKRGGAKRGRKATAVAQVQTPAAAE